MSYFYILKDSLRETRDSKVLYFTLVLVVLLFVFLAGLSFRPVTMQEEVENVASQLNFLFRIQAQGRPQGSDVRCEIVDFQQLNDADVPWQGDYRFTFVLKLPSALMASTFAEPMTDIMRKIIPAHFWWLKDLQMKETASPDRRDVRMIVTSRGTMITDEHSWTHEPNLCFGALPLPWFRASLTYAVYWIENHLVNTMGGWVVVLLGVVVTSSFIPAMLRKGTVDLLLAKPISRGGLLLFKYVGGLTFVCLNTAVTIGGVWLILGLRTGIWTYSFPLTVLVLTFFFAILYAVSTLFAVLTRSTVVCILVTLLAWATLFAFGLVHDWLRPPSSLETPQMRPTVTQSKHPGRTQTPSEAPDVPDWLLLGVDAVYLVLPRTADLDRLSTRLLSEELLSPEERQHRFFEEGEQPGWAESLAVSAAFIAVVLGLSCWLFVLKDY